MKDIVTSIDVFLRRNRGLLRLQWLRNLLRPLYYRLLRLGRNGVGLEMSGTVKLRVPVEHCIKEMETYEPETVATIAKWVAARPGSVFIDIGCSVGYISCAVRFLDSSSDVVAVDADVPSLEVARRVCSFCPKGRGSLIFIQGLVGPFEQSSFVLDAAVKNTETKLEEFARRHKRFETNYVCLDTTIPESALPRFSLDDLLSSHAGMRSGKPCLVKCDVEGAENLVLAGAKCGLALRRFSMLLSVHPKGLHKYGGSVEGIRLLLAEAGYQVTVLAVDHEEHWLCEPFGATIKQCDEVKTKNVAVGGDASSKL